MNDRKGFTLIELLVAITIIGIIMIMVLPAVHNLQRENQEKKFDDYERAVLEAAKVYEDQYEEDLFGRSDTGCASIEYDRLIQKKLISTTKIAGYECSGNDNGIIIRKVNGKSFYEVYLTCNKGSDNKQLTSNTGFSTYSSETHCKVGDDTTPPNLTIYCDGEGSEGTGVQGDDYESTTTYYYSATNTVGAKRLPKLKVKVFDDITGLEKNQYITYEWKMYSNKELPEEKPDSTEKNRTTFNIKDGTGSTSSKNVRIIEKFKEPNTTGKAIVDLIGENIVDRIGNKLDPTTGREKCTYFYDNAKPKITITLTGASGANYNIDGEEWINEVITTSVEATDQTPNNIYSGIKKDTLTRNGENETLTDGPEVYKYSRTDDNRKETDTFNVCDKVGNCYSDTVNIRVDTTPPVCGEVDTSAATPWTNVTRTVTIKCSDNLSGCKTDTFSKSFGNDSETGIITIEDNAGNTTDCTVYTKVDKTKPVCKSSGGQKQWFNTSLTITGTCTDNLSGCVQSTYTKQYSSEIDTSKGYGGNACDVAGNCADCSKDQDVHIDKTPPSCEFIDIDNENVANTPLYMQVKCTDDKALKYCGHDEANHEFDNPQKRWFRSLLATGDMVRDVWDMAGNFSQCKIKVSVSRCTSDCCGTKKCGCDSNGKNCDRCPKTCTKAKCCGYHVSG